MCSFKVTSHCHFMHSCAGKIIMVQCIAQYLANLIICIHKPLYASECKYKGINDSLKTNYFNLIVAWFWLRKSSYRSWNERMQSDSLSLPTPFLESSIQTVTSLTITLCFLDIKVLYLVQKLSYPGCPGFCFFFCQ